MPAQKTGASEALKQTGVKEGEAGHLGSCFLFSLSLSLSLFLYVYTVEGCRVLQCYVTGDDMGLQATGFQKRVETVLLKGLTSSPPGFWGVCFGLRGLGFRV